MASSPLMKFEELIQPIPGDSPAGKKPDHDALKELRRENLNEMPPKCADWPRVLGESQKILKESSKDLLVAAFLTEALTKLHGFAGLRDGLHLLRLLVEHCWDRLHPISSDGDLANRAGPFNWLGQEGKRPFFPEYLRLIPIVPGENGSYGLQDWRSTQEGKGPVSLEEMKKAIHAAPSEHFLDLAGDIQQGLDEYSQLEQALMGKLGEKAPAMIGLQQALEACKEFVQQILEQKPSIPPDGEPTSQAKGESSPPVTGSRTEAYQQLARAAATLRKLEPHSPIPYLIQRAVELGKLEFPDLIEALIRDEGVLKEISREMGIPKKSKE